MSLTDFLDLCESYSIGKAVMVVLLLAGCSLFLLFMEPLLGHIRHRRNRYYFAFGLLYLAVDIGLYSYNVLPLSTTVILAAADMIYLTYCAVTIAHCSPIAAFYIRKYKGFLDAGLTSEHISYFKKKHWYFLETTDKIEYARLKTRYYADIGLFKEAYYTAAELKADDLYEDEAQDFATMRAMLLWHMGDFSAATKLLESEQHDNNPVKYMLASFILEFSGDLDGAYVKMREAKDLCASHQIRPEYHMQILLDFGRIQRLRGNLSEAVQYMHQANKMLEQMKAPRADLQKNIKESLIFNEALIRGNDPHVEKLLHDYQEQIPADSVGNLISYNNCCIEVYRQLGDKHKVYELIKDGYAKLIGKLDDTQKALYQASTFRMVMNGEYTHEWLDKDVADTYKDYAKLPVRERLMVYKEYMGVFQQPEFYCVRNKAPYPSFLGVHGVAPSAEAS